MKYKHTNIVSLDWKKLVDFYIKVFNCKIVPPIRNQSGEILERGTGLKGAKLEGAHLLLPGHGENGPTLEIYQYETVRNQEFVSPNTRGMGHIAFEVENIDDVLKNVLENKGQSCGQIAQLSVEGRGELQFVYVRDPEGNLIELQTWDLISS